MGSVSLANWVMASTREMRDHCPSKSRARGAILGSGGLSQLRNSGLPERFSPGQNQVRREPYGTMSWSVVHARGAGVASIFRFRFGRLQQNITSPPREE